MIEKSNNKDIKSKQANKEKPTEMTIKPEIWFSENLGVETLITS